VSRVRLGKGASSVRALLLLFFTALLLASCMHARPKPPYTGPVSCEPAPADLQHPCIACLKASCCAETKACDRASFPPDSRARSEAAQCLCLFLCGIPGRPLAHCEERCGPASDSYRAMTSCVEDHCSEACEKENSGGPL